MTILPAIMSCPSESAVMLAIDDWSNYAYLILIVLSGLGALANKAIERFGGRKGADVQEPSERDARKYPPLEGRRNRPRSTPQSAPPPPVVTRRPRTPRPAPKPTARPVARRAPARVPAPPPQPQRSKSRPASPPQHKHAAYEDLPSEVAEHVAYRAAVEEAKAKPRPKKAKSRTVDRAALSETTETPRWTGSAEYAIHGLANPKELRRAILLREILGPPVALREDDPWSA